MPDKLQIHPVILCGGAGTRLWPMSREAWPKQFQKLTSGHSLLQETAARTADAGRYAPPFIVCNHEHRFIVAEQLRQIDIAPGHIVLEPVQRNTAPAAAVAAVMLAARDPAALMLVLPSDHAIADVDAFHAAVATAAGAAASGALVTFGIAPDAPETGYGYIHRGAPLGDVAGCYDVAAFAEKPDRAAAEGYLADGGWLWNSGMFLFGATDYLAELERLEPDMVARCREAVAGAVPDLDFDRLDVAPFEAAPSRSIDYAVMEHTARAVVVPAEIGWCDVGAWSALWEFGTPDGAGNLIAGDVVAVEATGNYLRGEGRLVAALGIEDLVVVATEDAVLVVPMNRAQDVRTLVEAMKAEGRTEAEYHPRVYRPWGHYHTVHEGERFQVKRITVNPGASLSLQMHEHRAEHWIVIAGTARVTRGDEVFTLNGDQSTFIPPRTKHRLQNPTDSPLVLIEVQSGAYLGEDDIVRFEDDYGRA